MGMLCEIGTSTWMLTCFVWLAMQRICLACPAKHTASLRCITPEMMMQIPWANLGKSAVVVEIDRLYILAGPKIEVATGEDAAYVVSTGTSLAGACMRST